jgi:tetratricopeptide (TPR) repeat protein
MRAALTAILLGTATMTALVLPAHAQAQVSARVGAALKEAQALATAGNYKAAMAKINEADGAPGKTPADNTIINQMRNFVAVKSGDTSTAAGAKAKFAMDYNARKWKDVIGAADTLRKHGALGAQEQLLIAQAYYSSGDFAGCSRYVKTLGNGDTALELAARCAYENGDEVTQRQALETLVSRGGKPEHWKSLLRLAERTRSLSDAMLTGNIVTKDDYLLLAQLAVQLGNAAEAQSVTEKGIAAKVLNDERSTRLLNLAKTQAAANAANLQKNIAAGRAQGSGEALLRVGSDLASQGKGKEALPIVQEAIKKGLKDQANGQITLGRAYLAAGQKADAQKIFSSVKAPPKDQMVANLWTVVSRR